MAQDAGRAHPEHDCQSTNGYDLHDSDTTVDLETLTKNDYRYQYWCFGSNNVSLLGIEEYQIWKYHGTKKDSSIAKSDTCLENSWVLDHCFAESSSDYSATVSVPGQEANERGNDSPVQFLVIHCWERNSVQISHASEKNWSMKSWSQRLIDSC